LLQLESPCCSPQCYPFSPLQTRLRQNRRSPWSVTTFSSHPGSYDLGDTRPSPTDPGLEIHLALANRSAYRPLFFVPLYPSIITKSYSEVFSKTALG
jgi:hypothetical protein